MFRYILTSVYQIPTFQNKGIEMEQSPSVLMCTNLELLWRDLDIEKQVVLSILHRTGGLQGPLPSEVKGSSS